MAGFLEYLKGLLSDERSYLGVRPLNPAPGTHSPRVASHPLAPEMRIYREPTSIEPERVFSEPATALLIEGIVNPFGPTLTAFVISGRLEASAQLPVVRLMLNPFAQEVEVVGEIALGAIAGFPSEAIRPVFDLASGSCPTLLLRHSGLPDDFAVPLYAGFLRRFTDGSEVLERVKQYFGDPWNRVSAEMASGMAHLQGDSGADRTSEAQPLNDTGARELSDLLQSEEHAKPELQAFLYAWQGSIESTGVSLDSMSLAVFVRAFDHLALSCRIPTPSGTVSELYWEMDSGQKAAKAIGRVVERLESLLAALREQNRTKALASLTEVCGQVRVVWGENREVSGPILQILEQVENDIRLGEFEEPLGSVLAILARLRETAEHAKESADGRITPPSMTT